MFRSLRNRLIFSHILPSLVIIPLMGIAMLYLLETRLLLPMIYANLSDDAILIAEVARAVPDIWQNPLNAQVFAAGADPYLGGRLTLIDPNGYVLASTDPNRSFLSGEVVELPNLSSAGRGDVVQIQRGPQAAVFTPVIDNFGRSLGVVRLTTRLLSVSEEVYQLRYLLMGVLLLAVLAGIGLGSYLAVTIGRPVGQVTEAINTLTQGDMHTRLPERGPREMRVLTRAVNTLVERLDSLEQARRQLLANLVHELGRPLGALHSAIRALQKGADRDPQLSEDLLNGMDAQTLRLQRLLDDLAGLYDQVLGPLELNRQVIVVQEWLPAVLVPWEAAAKEKGLGWQVQLADAPPDLLADPDRLAQAIGNLCSNAVKFTPNGGQVTVQTGMDQQHFWIQVKDNGPGILPQDQGKVFEPFFRGPHDRRIRQGMGLGLTIARDIINAHQGEIEMHSEPGVGSEFTIYLPL